MELACESFKFFTHGGMVFLFSTSILFAVVRLVALALNAAQGASQEVAAIPFL